MKASHMQRVQLAAKIRDYHGARMGDKDSSIVCYDEIADALGCKRTLVWELLATAGGGENGIALKR